MSYQLAHDDPISPSEIVQKFRLTHVYDPKNRDMLGLSENHPILAKQERYEVFRLWDESRSFEGWTMFVAKLQDGPKNLVIYLGKESQKNADINEEML